MKSFQTVGWSWLVLGALGSVYKCWHAVSLGSFIYFKAGASGLAWELGECMFALGIAAAGCGLVRGWRWSRFAVVVLATILLGFSSICLLFADFAPSVRATIYLAPAIFALASLIIALFFRYEPRRA